MSNLGLSECYKKKIITHLILNAWEKTHEFSLRTCGEKNQNLMLKLIIELTGLFYMK